ncbi:MAG TPA: chromosomal replication initiator protein DnaA [Dehalococcoidia bacterium]|nr:chromosomal replication initiator protein DnaA [Dehalococcoidia bacterium]
MTIRNAAQVWQAALGELQLQVSKANYTTWLKDTQLISYEDGLFVIGAPTAFATEWLENRLQSLVKKTLISITGRTVDVRFVVSPSGRTAARGIRTLTRPADPTSARPATPTPISVTRPFPSAQPTGLANLNARYTFETFIVGSTNRLAHAAARGVAEKPGEGYNPLFIYGPVGLGKTHLLHAIGNVTTAQGKNVVYVSTETFTNEFINAIRERKAEEFRAKYRQADVLLIDDIHFISGKEQTQEEFFHTFNDLHSSNRQIVLTSDRPPKSMPLLEDRLRSRFEWGLITDVQPPDFETRVAILRTKALANRIVVGDDVLDFVAHKVKTNIRELEGSLNRVMAYAQANRIKITVEVASAALSELSPNGPTRRTVSPDIVINTVAEYYGVEAKDLRGKKRDQEIAFPRQIAMHLMREELQISLSEIGKHLGGRDHTTVMYGCDKIGRELGSNGQLRREVLEIKESLYAGRRM